MSATSISCPATVRPATSPVPPPTASVPIPAAAPFNLLPVLRATLVASLEANPPDNASIAPIAIPLPADLYLIRSIASASSNTFLIPSLLNSNPFSLSSSWRNSVNDKAVSSDPPNPPIAPAIAPGTPATPAPPTPVATPAANEPLFAIDTNDEVNNCGINDKLFPRPLTKPNTPPPSFSYIF